MWWSETEGRIMTALMVLGMIAAVVIAIGLVAGLIWALMHVRLVIV